LNGKASLAFRDARLDADDPGTELGKLGIFDPTGLVEFERAISELRVHIAHLTPEGHNLDARSGVAHKLFDFFKGLAKISADYIAKVFH
jgi:hypothetical protein